MRCFRPFRMNSSPSRTARDLRSRPVPASGSVSPNATEYSPVAIRASNACFCGSLASWATAFAVVLWTCTITRTADLVLALVELLPDELDHLLLNFRVRLCLQGHASSASGSEFRVAVHAVSRLPAEAVGSHHPAQERTRAVPVSDLAIEDVKQRVETDEVGE